MKTFEIRNWKTNEVIFSGEYNSLKACVEDAVEQGVSLAYADLRCVNLKNAILVNANLEDADLYRANLENANLAYTNLENARFYRANLENTNLGYANLKNADLGYVNLEDANLYRANLENANLAYTNLENVRLEDANLRGSNLENANLVNVKLLDTQGNTKEIISISTEIYYINIIIPTKRIQIGCKNYSIDQWFSFSDDEIFDMDVGALIWWKSNKDMIKSKLIKLNLI